MRDLDECAAYFKDNPGFARLMEGLYDQYQRYERCFGAVRLVDPKPEEEKCVSDFFRRDYYNQALIRIGLADFERQIQKLFSTEIRLETLLEAYFKKQVIRRATARNTVNAFAAFMENEYLPRYKATVVEPWLKEVALHARRIYRVWAERYNTDSCAVEAMFDAVCKALFDLPSSHGKTMCLSEFALKHTGNVHAFHRSGTYGPLFLRALAYIFETPFPSSPEECGALYFKAGLMSEGVLSQVAVRGISAECGSEPDAASSAYDKRREPHVLTLENMSRFTGVKPYNQLVFVMEHINVFSAVNEQTRNINCTLVCASNGLNPALLYLLDLCRQSGAMIYYSGDMDYKGLCLADRLYLRYRKQFVPWRYDKSDYERIMSNNDFVLSESKKDIGLYNEDLASLLSLMRKKNKTACQTSLIPDLVNDIREKTGNDYDNDNGL